MWVSLSAFVTFSFCKSIIMAEDALFATQKKQETYPNWVLAMHAIILYTSWQISRHFLFGKHAHKAPLKKKTSKSSENWFKICCKFGEKLFLFRRSNIVNICLVSIVQYNNLVDYLLLIFISRLDGANNLGRIDFINNRKFKCNLKTGEREKNVCARRMP